MIKRLLPFILLVISASSCKHGPVWNDAYEKKAYKECYAGTSKIFPDTAQRRKFCLYIVKYLKADLPNGISSVSSDSLNHIYQKLTIDYVKVFEKQNYNIVIPWTASAEVRLRNTLLSAPFIKKVPPAARQKFCDCIVKEIRKVRPDSLKLPLPDSVYLRAIGECKTETKVN